MSDELLVELESLLVEAMAGAACARRRSTCRMIYLAHYHYADLLHVEVGEPAPLPRRMVSVESLLGARGPLVLAVAAWLNRLHCERPACPLRGRGSDPTPADPIAHPPSGGCPVLASSDLWDSVPAVSQD